MPDKKQIIKAIKRATQDQAVASESSKVTKQVPDSHVDITYIAWSAETLQKYPVTPKLLGKKVMLASKPQHQFKLKAMYSPKGHAEFPHGGYILESPDGVIRRCFLDEVKCKSKDKPKS